MASFFSHSVFLSVYEICSYKDVLFHVADTSGFPPRDFIQIECVARRAPSSADCAEHPQ